MCALVFAASAVGLTPACGLPPIQGAGAGAGEGEGEGEPSGFDVAVTPNTIPCEVPAAWPIALPSPVHAYVLHLRDESERPIGEQLMAALDRAWGQELALGFPEPPGDEGACGDDDAIDVFLFAGSELAYVDYMDIITATPFSDVGPFLVIDYEYWLDSTVAHELNHTMQAACDWNETAFIYEASSQFIEETLFDSENSYRELLFDYQGQADRAIDYDDGYAGYYLYGSVLYLLYLDETTFADDPTWLGRLWISARSIEDPANDFVEPDIEDVLDDMLQSARSMSFIDSVIEFARWRYYLSDNDDGRHFSEAAELLSDAKVPELALEVGGSTSAALSELGSLYLSLSGAADAVVIVTVTGALDQATLVAQGLPGLDGSDGERIAGSTSFNVTLSTAGKRILALTLVPPAARADPDVVERPRVTLGFAAAAP